ncbi:hypothetical protein ABB02_00115 [Clostridiaceae bacterium JG1575]|nr:hypothetical protein ABB02_00115 [Clostridiaceae bacterium JG1575]
MTKDLPVLTLDRICGQSSVGRYRDVCLQCKGGDLLVVWSKERQSLESFLEVLARERAPLSGRLVFQGTGLAWVSLTDELAPWAKVGPELTVAARASGMAPEALSEALSDWDLEGTAHMPWEALTLYEQRALLWLLALTEHPDLLLLFEPLEGLNAAQCDKAMEHFRRYAKGGRIVLIATVTPWHYPKDLPTFSLDSPNLRESSAPPAPSWWGATAAINPPETALLPSSSVFRPLAQEPSVAPPVQPLKSEPIAYFLKIAPTPELTHHLRRLSALSFVEPLAQGYLLEVPRAFDQDLGALLSPLNLPADALHPYPGGPS